QVLRAPQPLAAWSRSEWVPLAKKLGRETFNRAAQNANLSVVERVRALEVLVEVFGFVGVELGRKLVESQDAEVAARAVWALQQEESRERAEILISATKHSDARVRRSAWESLGALSGRPGVTTEPRWRSAFVDEDRRVRAAAVVAARSPAWSLGFRAAVKPEDLSTAERLGWLRATAPQRGEVAGDSWLEWTRKTFLASSDHQTGLDTVRMIVRGLGDVALVQERRHRNDGYRAARIADVSTATRTRLGEALLSVFPTGERDNDLEIARALAMLEVELGGTDKFATLWSRSSRVEDDIHHLLALAHVAGPLSPALETPVAEAFAALHWKMRERNYQTSRFWPSRVLEAYRELRKKLPGIDEKLVQYEGFGDPGHVLFVDSIENAELKARATKKLVESALKFGLFSGSLVEKAAKLGTPESVKLVRGLTDDPTYSDSATRALARMGLDEDREIFVGGLSSVRSDVVRACADALVRNSGSLNADETFDAVLALRKYCGLPREGKTRGAILKLLDARSEFENSPPIEESKNEKNLRGRYAAVFRWFEAKYPDLADELRSQDLGPAEIADRALKFGVDKGDAKRGAALFAKKGCEGCHRGARRLGPELKGIGSRFSTRDLVIAIADPSRDISPAYQSTEVVTKSGVVHQGLVVYDSPAGTLLQTGAETAVRFSAKDVTLRRKSSSSFMPNGLLDGLSSQELVDLLSYLRELK
ncbi:MAG: hypothetical protein AAF517_13800, partial [Planctomycetota bacterium]